VDEERKGLFAVDQEHRNTLPVAALELVLACDVDLLELELDLGAHLLDDAPSALAEVAALRRVEREPMDRARG
jgi:hypothetical protein